MPVYSITRTNQYTTVAQLQLKSNQDFATWSGNDGESFHSNFVVSYLTVCPTANRTWNYATPASPTSAHVWYPYNLTMACSGGNPDGSADRNGYAYFKLYTSTGSFIMGSSIGVPASPLVPASSIPAYNALANGGNISAGASVLATSFPFINSRNTLSLTANTTYVAGFTGVYTSTAFYNIFARSTQTGQNVYISTGELAATNVSLTVRNADTSIMGYLTYNSSPPQPTNLVITTTSTGISITCQSNEVQSFISSVTESAVVYVRFFYSETLGGTYNYVGADTSITRTLISGTTYQYTATFEGGTTLTQGKQYYFKVATMNDVCIQYQSENAGSIPASEQSTAVLAQYGSANVVRVRNSNNNGWTTIDVKVRNINNTWTSANVAVRNVDDDAWLYN
jgi:hypothetical protein